MAAEEKWYLSKEQLANTPSRKCGYDADKELSNRQQAANFIQDMGQRLQVTQLCINTAIVYMHRFYVYHSFSHFHRNAIATAALFLAAKVEEQPRKLEHVIKVGHVCLHRETPPLDTKSENYLEQAQELVFNENVLLQTLGFDVAIDHPHTHVVRCCHMVKASKDLAQTSYFMASNSLHLTTMCLQYKPTVVACFCIHLACKWSNWEIPVSNEGKDWFYYVDKSVTFEQLETLTTEFLQIFDKCPTKLKRKIMSITATQTPMIPTHSAQPSQLFDNEPRKVVQDPHHRHPLLPSPSPAADDPHRRPVVAAAPHTPSKVLNLDVYRRKEKERVEREGKQQQQAVMPPVARESQGHHHGKPPAPVPPAPTTRPPPVSGPPRTTVTPSRDLARREQAQARELTKQRDAQQSSIFSPPTKHDTPDKDCWQEPLNHNNELDTNRHNSDKYNLVNKDSRPIDPKRLHSKDQRVPVVKEGQKLSAEDSQRMYNKYNHRKPEEDHTKRPPSLGPAVKPHPKDGTRKPPPPVPHLPGAKSQHGRAPSGSSQHRGSSPFVQHPKVATAASNPKPDSVDVKVHKSVHATPTKVDPRNGHPIERREVNHRQETVKLEPGLGRLEPSVKQEPGLGRLEPSVKQEPGLGRLEPAVKQEPVPFRLESMKQEAPRLDLVKQEPSIVHKSQSAGPPHKATDVPIKMEIDAFSATTSQPPPKSSSSSSRSTSKSSVSGPNVNSSSSSSGNRERPSKPSSRHPVPSPAPKKHHPPPETPVLPSVASPEFGSPPPPVPNTPTKNVPTTPGYSSRSHNRNRTSSSSSEPELVPYVTKLEEIAGYENILESKKGIKLDKLPLPGRVPDMIQPIRDRVKEESHSVPSSRTNVNSVSKELRPPDLIRPFSTMAPSLAKSVDVGAIAFPAEDSDPTNVFIKSESSLPNIVDVVNVNETESIKTIIEPSKLMPLGIALDGIPPKSDHPHKSEKKKKKEKHKHKDKDKSKDREERKHKRKHKDKDKEKHREKAKEVLHSSSVLTAPIKITIPKERLAQATIDKNPPQPVLKFKIQKPTSCSPQSTPGGELKLKISRNTIVEGFPPKESRKRDRSACKTAPDEPKPAKAPRLEAKNHVKHNGVRGQHHKVPSSQTAGSSETGRGSKGGSQPL